MKALIRLLRNNPNASLTFFALSGNDDAARDMLQYFQENCDAVSDPDQAPEVGIAD
jgi:hypothetical protein